MAYIWTRLTRSAGFQPPPPGFVLNEDSPQAEGLYLWVTPHLFVTGAVASNDLCGREHSRWGQSLKGATAGVSPVIEQAPDGRLGLRYAGSSNTRVQLDSQSRFNAASISLSAWFWLPDMGTGIQSILDRDGGTRCWQFRISSGKVQWIPFITGATTTTGSIDVDDGKPHHAVCQFDNVSKRRDIWTDSKLEISAVGGTTLVTGTKEIMVAAYAGTNTQRWETGGIMDARARSVTLDGAGVEHEYSYPYDLYYYPGERVISIPAAAPPSGNPMKPPTGLALLGIGA